MVLWWHHIDRGVCEEKETCTNRPPISTHILRYAKGRGHCGKFSITVEHYFSFTIVIIVLEQLFRS